MRMVVLLAVSLLVAQPAAAQAEGFIRLGEDGTGEPQIPDTIFDILYIDAATQDENVVFDLGLQGTTSEVTSACPVVAFQVGGTEYLAFDCFECAAYECTNAASGVSPPASSRGERVGTVELLENTARMTVGFEEIGVGVGDPIDDIYGLTYFSRVLNPQDAAPDVKQGDAGAAESFGSYVVGVGRPGGEAAGDAAKTINGTLAEPSLRHAFANATSDTYILNLTTDLSNATAALDVGPTAGSVDVSLTDGAGGRVLEGAFANATRVLQNITGAAPGDWSLRLDYQNFTGNLTFSLAAFEAPPEDDPTPPAGNTTDGNETLQGGAAGEESPALPIALLLAAFMAVAARRRR